MCGFAGVVGPRAIELADLRAMRDRLAHRGPDGARLWNGSAGRGFVSLAHRRLSIIDLSEAAAQPMFSADRRIVIVYNGEIYNYIELREELRAHGRRFRTRSDTEVLLAAYEKWGYECLSRLNGMFAFALWDAGRNQLFVARDRFGEKPLFYAQLSGGGFAFASEMKALFAHPEITASPDSESVDAYAAGGTIDDGSTTMFAGVRRVPPASAMVVDPDGTISRTWRYWTPDYSVSADFEEGAATEEFRRLLERSVRMRLRSDVPVGTSLSGGLDSSMIVCLIRSMRDQTGLVAQNAFSGRFDDVDPTLSEGRHIDLIVDRADVVAHAVTPNAERLIEESELLHWHQEEPFLSASIYLQWCVMRLAAEHDTTVLLDGQGADELLGGYQFYFPNYQLDLLERGRLLQLARETHAFRARLRQAAAEYKDSHRRFNSDIALGFAALVRHWTTRGSHTDPAYAVGLPARGAGMRLRTQMAEALQYNSLPQLLRYADRNAMAFSREARYPFLDYDLVDWCVSLPDKAFTHHGWQKYILRRAGAGLLPTEVQWRADKVGYAAPLDIWLRTNLREWAEARLFSGPIVDLDAYDAAALRILWRDHQSGANHSWALWRWISLNEWFSLLDSGRWRRGIAPVTSAAEFPEHAYR